MGIAAPLVSNIGWGVLPLYWRALSSMNATSVLAYRLVATLAAMVALLVAFVFLQIGVHSMGTIFQQHRRLVSSRNCVVGSAAFFLVIWS